VPTLAEVLELVSGRGGVALEIKNIPGEPGYEPGGESIAEAAVAEVHRVGFEGPVLVVSFNPRSIATARAIAPEIPTGLLTTQIVDPREALAHAVEFGHGFILPGSRSLRPAGEALVAEAHAAGVRVGTWTVDDPDEIRVFLDMGVDAVASNNPAMALAVLGERGR
jgi:glycerophosphoryl diester phosphodiesterase